MGLQIAESIDLEVIKQQTIEDLIEDVLSGGGNNVDELNETFGKKFDSAFLFDRYNLQKVNPLVDFEDVTECEAIVYKFIENEGIELYVIPDDRSEMFVCTKQGYKAIYMCPKDYEDESKTRLISLCHELGHYCDLKYNFNFDPIQFQLTGMYNTELIKTETVAWAYAWEILDAVGFEDWSKTYNETLEALTTYTSDFNQTIKHLRNASQYLEERAYRENSGE